MRSSEQNNLLLFRMRSMTLHMPQDGRCNEERERERERLRRCTAKEKKEKIKQSGRIQAEDAARREERDEGI